MTNEEKWIRHTPWSGKVENFVRADADDKDVEDFFGPFQEKEKEAIVFFQDFSWTLAHIAVHLKKFPSITQAKKNGWGGDIPKGFKEHKIGKTRFWTFVPIE